MSTAKPTPPDGVQRRWMRTDKAAAYLSLSIDHMKGLRVRKRGPAYRKVGRVVLYAVADLDSWVMTHKPRAARKAA